jgi:hypothetical protein
MNWEDLRRFVSSTQLYRLDSLIGARLVPVLYGLGIAAIALWSIAHLVEGFAFAIADGLWAILEIIVFAPLSLVALRIVAEVTLVYFKAHESEVIAVDKSRGRNTLLEDIGDAIRDLAEDDKLPTKRDPGPVS